ncbi:transporter [Penicillium maclennaniae]|uniref:transporter n=1 Tax=Penicillium maclennaniae TaxID=1343394 RepID=UPI002540929F|nr:transporter [Penicillium maclennaniae]KAJ5678124.1 transporter [Penicillium maclennaniae]
MHVSSNVSNSDVTVSNASVSFSESNTSTPNEYTRLLPKLTPKPIEDECTWDDEVDKDASKLPRGKRILTEFLELFKGSVPVIMAYMLQMSLQTIPVIIVGHLSPMYLAVSAFSLMFALVTGWMIALGGTTAMDTLASSTFTGIAITQPTGIMRAGTYVLLITSPLNAGLCYLFCYTLDIGLLGAPLAANISYWTSFIMLVLYAKFVAGSECWGGWTRAALTNLWTFARLAILGILHVGTEWWAFEIVALVAGRLGTTSLASQSVIMTADQIMNTIPFGLGVATSSRVGNLLGARKSKGASLAAHSSAILAVGFGAVVLAILIGTRNNFAKIFNNDPEVIELTAEIMPFVALFQIADGMNGSCGGSLRGMGRQHVGAAINLVSYYCFALPLGVYLAFHGWGLKGLWVGQCVALYCAGVLEWVLVACTRWETEVRKAFKRMDGHGTLESGAGPEIAGNE